MWRCAGTPRCQTQFCGGWRSWEPTCGPLVCPVPSTWLRCCGDSAWLSTLKSPCLRCATPTADSRHVTRPSSLIGCGTRTPPFTVSGTIRATRIMRSAGGCGEVDPRSWRNWGYLATWWENTVPATCKICSFCAMTFGLRFRCTPTAMIASRAIATQPLMRFRWRESATSI